MKKMLCHTPTPGKAPTKIDLDKYRQVAEAILNVLPDEGDGLAFTDLPDLVADYLGESKMQAIGSRTWYTTTVKLHLETEGKIRRVAGKGSQRLLKLVNAN
ncbi:DUF6958 family protein [Planctobacterium marinum]|uniref:Uncharacterized protein n=1 Tax=Planctobacterium marinum TaxID=1631968 RepID=A0AA48HEM4_9ALTE|nr:hypothetical protein MACH26_04620 [Planctobacterium marinum]